MQSRFGDKNHSVLQVVCPQDGPERIKKWWQVLLLLRRASMGFLMKRLWWSTNRAPICRHETVKYTHRLDTCANNVPAVPVETPNMVAKVARNQGSSGVGGPCRRLSTHPGSVSRARVRAGDQVGVKSGCLAGAGSVNLCVNFSESLVSTTGS